MQQPVQGPRIDVRRLAGSVVFLLILPVSIGFLLDLLAGTVPFVTLGFVLIFFPLAGFFVVKTALAEMDRVIQIVAPDRIEEEHSAPE